MAPVSMQYILNYIQTSYILQYVEVTKKKQMICAMINDKNLYHLCFRTLKAKEMAVADRQFYAYKRVTK